MADGAIRRRYSIGALFSALTGTLWVLGTQIAHADPEDPCALLIPGSAVKKACENTQNMVNNPNAPSGSDLVDAVSDPLGSIAKSCGQGGSWLLGQLSKVLDGPTTKVNFTNMGFLKTYAVVFAASSVLVILVWLYAVIKRVINGVGPVTAITEAIGGLWLAVLASAFTPVVLAGTVTITDSFTEAIASTAPGARVPGPNGTWTTASGPGAYFSTLSSTLSGGPSPDLGGSIVFILISVLVLVIAAVLWLELLMRVAMLYIGGVLATVVYAGLVDKSFWPHVQRWVSMMVGLDLAKPLLVLILILGESVAVNGSPAVGLDSILAGLAIMFLGAFGTAAVYRLVPVIGEDLSWAKQLRVGTIRNPIMQVQQARQVIEQGMATHGNRGGSITPARAGGSGQDRIRPEAPPVATTQSWGVNTPSAIAARPQGPAPLRTTPPSQRPGGSS
jgi:hypothetical protein